MTGSPGSESAAATVPILQTARLTLRGFTEADATDMHRMLLERDVLRYFPSSEPPSLDRMRSMIQRLQAHWGERGYGLWAVVRSTDYTLLGRCGIQYLPDTDEVEIDFLLGREHWGMGYATEAGREALRYGFEKLDVGAIVGIVHPDNISSQHVLEKLGMTSRTRTEYFGMDCYRYVVDRAGYRPHIDAR